MMTPNSLSIFFDFVTVIFAIMVIPYALWLWRLSKGGILSKPLGFLLIAYIFFSVARIFHLLSYFYDPSGEVEAIGDVLTVGFIAGIFGLMLMVTRRMRELARVSETGS